MSNETPLRTRRYKSRFYDTARWDHFSGRDDDVFICTPPKCGTTWTQAICALLILGWEDFTIKPSDVSPWYDASYVPMDETNGIIESLTHRRFIKTHAPLDAMPYSSSSTYVAVYRDPRDVYFSMLNHRENMGFPVRSPDATASQDFREWVARPPVDREEMSFSLASVLLHYHSYAGFARLGNIHLLHYAWMKRNPPAAVRRIADILGIALDSAGLAAVVAQSGFDYMKENADQFAPDAARGLYSENAKFFSAGVNAQWAGVLSEADLDYYNERFAGLASSADCEWLTNGPAD
ncbi:MAG: sulfotransferase domain-containing protein [Pseudomonadota bacterium]